MATHSAEIQQRDLAPMHLDVGLNARPICSGLQVYKRLELPLVCNIEFLVLLR
jgi:hypothetical protein